MKSIMAHLSVYALLLLSGCGAGGSSGPSGVKSGHEKPAWWQLTARLAEQMPLTLDAIQGDFGLQANSEYSTKYRTDWVGGELALRDNVLVKSSNLSMATSQDPPSFIRFTMHFSGSCIDIKQAQEKFPEMKANGMSSPHAAEHFELWSVGQSWGQLNFAFTKGRGSGCLDRITFSPSRS